MPQGSALARATLSSRILRTSYLAGAKMLSASQVSFIKILCFIKLIHSLSYPTEDKYGSGKNFLKNSRREK
jgi:hypothetical protein